MRRKNTKDIVLTSIFSAIILLLSLVPNLGFIRVGVISITIVHIPVLLAVMFLPFLHSLFIGFIFGIGSLIAAFAYGTALDVPFQNPVISVLPRMLFAEFAWGAKWLFFKTEEWLKKHSYIVAIVSSIIIATTFFLVPHLLPIGKGLKDVLYILFAVVAAILISVIYLFHFKYPKRKISVPVVAILSTIFHTLVVLLFLYLLYFDNTSISGYFNLIGSVIASNGILEIMLSGFVVSVIYYSLNDFIENKFR